MSLKDKINSENPLISLENLSLYHSRMSALQQANTNKIAQIIGELAEATAQLTKTTTKVNCEHRYEITGATNDEHNLAIEDQQMLINKISGRTLVRNQVIDIRNAQEKTVNGMTSSVSVDTGVITISGTSTYEEQTWFNIQNKVNLIKGHVYLLCGCPAGGSTNTYGLYLSSMAMNSYIGDFGEGKLFTAPYDAVYDLSFFTAGTITVNYKVKPQLIDLTFAYGVGNEPTTIEEVLNDFPEYIPYNEGTFVHSNNKLISTGKNLWSLGDQSFTTEKYVFLDKPIKAGTYTISCFVTSTDTDESKCVMAFYSSHDVVGAYVTGAFFDRNTRSSVKVVFNKDVYTISLRSAESYNLSKDDISNWKDIQIEYGEVETDYEPYKEEVIEGIGELKQYQDIENISGRIIDNTIFYTVSEEEGYGYNDSNIKNSFYIAGISASFKNIGANFAGKYLFNNNKITKFYVGTHPNYPGRLDAVIETAKYYETVEEFMADIKGSVILGESTVSTITESNLPAGMSVYKGGYQIQEGTIPYLIEKQYALSIASQVKQNIEIDREQQKQIDNMKVDIDHKQSLLLSGQNIKTFNGQSMLGSGDLAWNDPMFLAKFNDVTDYVNQNNGIIDELLEGKTYRIYSDNDTSSSVYSFNVRLNLKISSGETKTYIITLPTKTKNFVDFRLDNIVLNGQRATLYYNVDNVDYTQLLTQQGDTVTGDYEIYGWGALFLSGTYAAVFEPVEIATKEDFDTLTSDEQPLDGLRYQVEDPGYVYIQLPEDMRIDLENINDDFAIYLEGHKCVIMNPNDTEIMLVGDSNLSGEVTIYNYANIPQICFSSANKGEILLEALKSNGVNQFLVEFKNNCFIFRNVFVGEI